VAIERHYNMAGRVWFKRSRSSTSAIVRQPLRAYWTEVAQKVPRFDDTPSTPPEDSKTGRDKCEEYRQSEGGT